MRGRCRCRIGDRGRPLVGGSLMSGHENDSAANVGDFVRRCRGNETAGYRAAGIDVDCEGFSRLGADRYDPPGVFTSLAIILSELHITGLAVKAGNMRGRHLAGWIDSAIKNPLEPWRHLAVIAITLDVDLSEFARLPARTE